MIVDAMRKTGYVVVALFLLMTVLMTTCGREEPEPAKAFTVRMLSSRTLSGRWERAAERGLGLIASELDADVARLRIDDQGDARVRLAEQGHAGVQLVFYVGAGVEKILFSEASAFPATAFVLLPGRVHGPNLGSIRFMPEEAGYLAGAVAGEIVPDRKVGLLRGVGGSWLEALEDGFVAGYRARQGRRKVTVEAAEGREGVWKLKSAGIGVALYASDRSDPAVLSAAHNAGMLLVASDPDFMNLEPEVVIAAIEVDVPEAMLRVAREVRDGTFSGKVFSFDLGSGVLDVKLNPNLGGDRGAAAAAALEDARSEVTAGLVEFDGLGL
jgi:basic membrane protein A